MSYMRGKLYVWTSNLGLHIWSATNCDTELMRVSGWASGWTEEAGSENLSSVCLKHDTFDALVMMRYAEMTDAERESGKRRAVRKYAGNVGCWGLTGRPPNPTPPQGGTPVWHHPRRCLLPHLVRLRPHHGPPSPHGAVVRPAHRHARGRTTMPRHNRCRSRGAGATADGTARSGNEGSAMLAHPHSRPNNPTRRDTRHEGGGRGARGGLGSGGGGNGGAGGWVIGG